MADDTIKVLQELIEDIESWKDNDDSGYDDGLTCAIARIKRKIRELKEKDQSTKSKEVLSMIDKIFLTLWFYCPCKWINAMAMKKYLKRNYPDIYNEL